MLCLFKRRKEKKESEQQNKRAVAFVDYEHWYISMTRMYNQKPDLKGWQEEISAKYDIINILFFADFSSGSIRAEIPRIREISNTIIETQNTGGFYKKDFTDFIMLDFIYQRAYMRESDEAFIIFTGDGHFSSVVRFLTNRCQKEVGVYAVKEAFSSQLKSSASWYVEIEKNENEINDYKTKLLANFERLEKSENRVRPTFMKTAERVAEVYNLDFENVKTALHELIHDDYVYQIKERFEAKKFLNVLYVDWAKVEQDGLYRRGSAS
ncbi:MAG: NYN domain-containing protein [Clostridiales bacterium]|nr:NYN domain-containing protein [Clostridiales bacterium]